MPSSSFRWPEPHEYGTEAAVKGGYCPSCFTRYRVLTRIMFVTTYDGDFIMVYHPGQKICNPCLRRNCDRLGVMVALS